MMEKIQDHAQEALQRLVTQFQGKPRIEGLLRALVQPNQDIEDTLWDLLTKRSIHTAIGKQLDGIGEIVGESRKGKEDEVYRIAIKAKIGQNNSKATAEDIISVFKLLVQCEKAFFMEYFPAEVAIFADKNIESLDNNEILKFCQKAVAAGVRLDYIGWYDGDHAFAFQDDPNAKGFGDAFDEAAGGQFATVTAYNY